jgi:chitodextrinase
MSKSAETARPLRNRRPDGAPRATSRLRPRAWLLVALLSVGVLLSAGGGLQQASAKSRQFLPITTEDVDLPPSTPQLLRVVGATETSLTLAWSASSDDGGVIGYEVRRADARGVTRVDATTHVITDLGCGRTYDVSVLAYDAVGNRSAAALLSAPTTPCRDAAAPSSPSALRLTYRTPTSISLSWRASSDNAQVTRYGAYVDAVLVGTSTSEAYTFADLKCGRNYTLAIDAVDAAGNRSAPATTMIATAACPDGTAPTSPNVVVNGTTKASVSVGWRAASDNVAVVGYELWLQNRMVGRLNSKKRTYTFDGLACGATYSTGVVAYDASGNRSSGTTLATATDACAATAPPPTGDTTPPTAPASVVASATTATGITLAWPAATDNTGVTEYGVYVGANRVGSTGATSYALSGLTCGTTYQVAVDAADAAGNRSAKTTASVATAPCGDTTAPSTPTGLQLMVANETSVTVVWSPSTDNVGVTGYGVYLSNLLVNSPTSPSVTLTGLTCGKPYFVEVDAKDAAGNRSGKASLWVNTKACPDTTAPSAPTGLTVPNKTQTSLTLQWTASTDNVAVTGYSLRRNGTATGNVTTTSGTFSGLTCGTAYTLDVTAYDAAGNRSGTTAASATTSACAAGDTQAPTTPTGVAVTGNSTTSITLGWNASTDNVGVAGYGVYSGGVRVGTTASRTYTLSGLACGTSYALGVDAYDAANNRSGTASLNGSTAACAPQPPPPSGTSAHLWIDPNGGSCTRAATAGGYSDTQACPSFAAAYSAAQSGDSVRVKAGTYPAQFFAGGANSSQGAGTKTLTFTGESGNVVRQIHSGSDNLTFDGIVIDAGGQKTTGAAFENGGGENVTFKNGRIGNVTDEKGALVDGLNMTFDNVVFHDVVLRTAGVHLECLMALWNEGMVIRNSRFENCGIMDASIGIGNWWQPPPPPYGNVTIENNWFGKARFDDGGCCAAYSLALWSTKVGAEGDWGVFRNWRVRNNYFEPGSGVIARPVNDGSSVFCGNTGNALADWKTPC